MNSTVSAKKNLGCLKIKYPKGRLQNNIGYGIVMIGVGLFAVYINSSSIFSYLWIVVGFLQLGTSLYQKKNQYITIEEDRLIKHSLIPKTIEVSKIQRIRKFVNSYRIETAEGSIRIEKDFIEEESLQDLQKFLDRLKTRVETTAG